MNNKKFSVFVCDDERLIAKNIARNIERCNPAFQVVSITHNGEDALDSMKEYTPQILFTDICMPVMDGLQLIEEAQKICPLLRCVIISGYNDFEYAKQAIKFGVTDYLLKPVNSEELTTLLHILEHDLLSDQEHLQLDQPSKNYTTEELVDLAQKYIQKNYASPIDLGELVSHLGFSASYLTKIFTKELGVTPSKYIRRYRMSIAKQLLANPNLSISDVANSVGYADQFHFSKSFKLENGISPTTYRDNLNDKK